MCDERERLIDYLYEACEADERRRVEAHLLSCEGCRDEIRGLRAVRLDLLGWDVPEHGSVWKPFAPARPVPWWREVPVWALAAAASVMFLLGIGGGLVARQWTPVQAAAAQAPTVSAPPITPAPVLTAADLAAVEQRIAQTVQARLDARVQPVAAHVVPAGLSEDRARALVQGMVGESEGRQKQQFLNLVHDSESRFVRQTTYNTFLNNELSYRIRQEVALALQQLQGGNK